MSNGNSFATKEPGDTETGHVPWFDVLRIPYVMRSAFAAVAIAGAVAGGVAAAAAPAAHPARIGHVVADGGPNVYVHQ